MEQLITSDQTNSFENRGDHKNSFLIHSLHLARNFAFSPIRKMKQPQFSSI